MTSGFVGFMPWLPSKVGAVTHMDFLMEFPGEHSEVPMDPGAVLLCY
jgi:hypothetical protein